MKNASSQISERESTHMRNVFLIAAALALAACSRSQVMGLDAAAEPSDSPADRQASAPPEPPHHHADLAPTQGSQARGTVEFISLGDAGVRVTGTISGLAPNSEHGFHIHEKGDCSAPDASSAGGHFNPTSQQHGNPGSQMHHAGDIPNLTADAQGTARVNAEVSGVTVSGSGENDILGQAVVMHAKADDYKSQPAGNSGGRIACGVIQ